MMMKQKPMNVRIKPTANASQRTKNRIAERGPWFAVERRHDNDTFGFAPDISTKEGWLLREVGGGWLGWLWRDEFEVLESVKPV